MFDGLVSAGEFIGSLGEVLLYTFFLLAGTLPFLFWYFMGVLIQLWILRKQRNQFTIGRIVLSLLLGLAGSIMLFVVTSFVFGETVDSYVDGLRDVVNLKEWMVSHFWPRFYRLTSSVGLLLLVLLAVTFAVLRRSRENRAIRILFYGQAILYCGLVGCAINLYIYKCLGRVLFPSLFG